MKKEVAQELAIYLKEKYPDASCTLHFSNEFECLVAIMLSAQSTDAGVNKVTPSLFASYPTPLAMSEASISGIEKHIHALGLYHAKAKNISALSKILVSEYSSKIPTDFAKLTSLPGVGNKTAWVYMIEQCGVPAFPVDTHIARVSKRLNLAKEADDPTTISEKLRKLYPKEDWIFLHRAIIYFGRNECKAIKSLCEDCPLKGYCSFFKKTSSIKGK